MRGSTPEIGPYQTTHDESIARGPVSNGAGLTEMENTGQTAQPDLST